MSVVNALLGNQQLGSDGVMASDVDNNIVEAICTPARGRTVQPDIRQNVISSYTRCDTSLCHLLCSSDLSAAGRDPPAILETDSYANLISINWFSHIPPSALVCDRADL